MSTMFIHVIYCFQVTGETDPAAARKMVTVALDELVAHAVPEYIGPTIDIPAGTGTSPEHDGICLECSLPVKGGDTYGCAECEKEEK